MHCRTATLAAAGLLVPALLAAQAQPMARPMTDAQFVSAALQGAPSAISSNAAVARIEATGTVTTLRPGTNGFTCTVLPDESRAPYCGDTNAWAWAVAAFTNQPKPPNTEPGVAYMAQGGMHYETHTGEIVMQAGPNTHTVQEPPHWMLMWPVDPATTGLPTKPTPGGVYIMFAGTPYAHLMIYQDPKQIRP